LEVIYRGPKGSLINFSREVEKMNEYFLDEAIEYLEGKLGYFVFKSEEEIIDYIMSDERLKNILRRLLYDRS